MELGIARKLCGHKLWPKVGLTCHCIFPPEGVKLDSGLKKDGQMKRGRFTEEQIIAVPKEHEAGAKTADLARRHGISEATIDNWKANWRHGCLSGQAVKLEEENAKLKKLLAEQMLDASRP